MPDQTISLADTLRSAADVLEAHPELPVPYITTSSNGSADLSWYLMHDSRDLVEQKATAQQIIRSIGGKWDKVPDLYSDFTFIQHRDGLRLFLQVQREAVCERVVTGTETVTIPAKAAEPERVEEREVVEWICEPLLAEVSA